MREREECDCKSWVKLMILSGEVEKSLSQIGRRGKCLVREVGGKCTGVK